MKQALQSKRIVTPNGIMRGAVIFENGKITAIVDERQIPSGVTTEDVGNAVVMPGIVDTHVHINEPGRTEWEGFATATQAAAAGGITTVIDMPLNCIPVTTTLAALQEKKSEMTGKLWVDCGFHGGVIPGNVSELAPMVKAGVRTFKAFMIDSGIPEFPASDTKVLREAMKELSRLDVPLLVHAEVDNACETTDHHDTKSYQAYLASRPPEWECAAIKQMIQIAEETGCRVHIVHLSAADAIPLIQQAFANGIKISAETCPHYLSLAAEDIPDGDGRFKCAPPIRGKQNQQRLWRGLVGGSISMIVSDHSPCTPQLKKLEEHNLRDAWGGISSLQFGLSLIWSLAERQGFNLNQLARWMCEHPAKLVKLDDRKGKIAPGFDADFVVWNPDESMVISKDIIRHRHKETPYEKLSCKGVVKTTYLRGNKIFHKGQVITKAMGAII